MYSYIKRLLDFVLAMLALIILSPLLGAIALLVRFKLGSPVIFRQLRPGKAEKIFTLYKFRTMTEDRDENGQLLSDEERLTKFGRALRATSLDELPELINILKGDMSFVGPRPLLVRDMVFMTADQRRRHAVRPGLTGLAQVNGRNIITWEDKLDYDLEYVGHMTLWQDMKIFFKTFVVVLRRDGISQDGMQTAEDLGDYLLHSGRIDDSFYEEKQNESRELVNIG